MIKKSLVIAAIFSYFGCSRQSHVIENQNACNTSHLIPSEFCNAQFYIQESDSVFGNCNISCFQTHYRYPIFNKAEKDSFFIQVNSDIVQSLINVVSLEEELQTYIAQYKDLIQKFPEYRSNWNITKDCQLLQMNHQLMTLQTKKSSYTGGPHSTQQTIYLTYDLQKKVALELNSLLIPKHHEDFKQLVIQTLKTQFENSKMDLIEMGFLVDEASFPIGSNFYMSDSFLHLHYNAYEIAPYATGEINIKIPLKELNNWLLNEYQKK